jgi:hypothetical protein
VSDAQKGTLDGDTLTRGRYRTREEIHQVLRPGDTPEITPGRCTRYCARGDVLATAPEGREKRARVHRYSDHCSAQSGDRSWSAKGHSDIPIVCDLRNLKTWVYATLPPPPKKGSTSRI